MDRRNRHRLIPTPEGMEPRQVLSGLMPSSSWVDGPRPAVVAPSLQMQRIDRLPFFLQTYAPDRVLPAEPLARVQDDLRALKNSLPRRPGTALGEFNDRLRETLSRRTISPSNLLLLDRAFGRVLLDAGADPGLAEALRTDLRDLVGNNPGQKQSAMITANDYAIVSQVALGVGRPATPPGVRPVATGGSFTPTPTRSVPTTTTRADGVWTPTTHPGLGRGFV